jgi:ribonuclease HI
MITIYADGASRGNPGKAGIGVSITGDINHQISEYIGEQTNNYAEYTAVLRAVEFLQDKDNFDFYLDSELVVKQINGEYKVKNPNIRPVYEKIMKLLAGKKYQFTWIRRDKNSIADALANQAIDSKSF